MATKKETVQVGRFPIEVPVIDYGAWKALYKIYFGKSGKYYIGKCMSLTQAIPMLGNTIAAAVRNGTMSEDNWLYQAVTYIRKNRVTRGSMEVVKQGNVPSHELLITEYNLLKKAEQDPNCLNQNTDVHIPKWVEKNEALAFLKFKDLYISNMGPSKWIDLKEVRDELNKGNKAGNRATNARKKHKGG